jgi:hypothetical protein
MHQLNIVFHHFRVRYVEDLMLLMSVLNNNYIRYGINKSGTCLTVLIFNALASACAPETPIAFALRSRNVSVYIY